LVCITREGNVKGKQTQTNKTQMDTFG